MGPIYSLGDFVDLLRRRVGLISFVILLGCFISVFWALSKPHIYQSSEVIQIEQPKIADDLARSTVAGSSARRLQLIEQQLMARDTLLEIIDKYGLYGNLPDLKPADLVYLLRSSISITGVAAVREGFADDGTISVLTFTATMDSPEMAQAVAHEIADRTRALSAQQRAEQTQETLAFFQRQEENLIRDIAALEEELVTFRRENELSIEGNMEIRRDELTSLNEALLELDREIISTQLAQGRVDPEARAETRARQAAALDAELESLKTQRRLLEDRRIALSASLETTPEVEQALTKFERRMQQLQGQLDVIATRRNEAEVGFTLESAARGERLTTIEEAPLPDYPISMSRKKRALMGAAASVFLALGLAFLLDLRRPIIRTAKQMERQTGLMPVVSIPDTRPLKRRKRRRIVESWRNRLEAGKKGRAARISRKPEAGNS